MSTYVGTELVLYELRKRRRPASVRRLTDALQKPTSYSRRVTDDQVRRWAESLVEQGLAARRRGRFTRSVRYIAITQPPEGPIA